MLVNSSIKKKNETKIKYPADAAIMLFLIAPDFATL